MLPFVWRLAAAGWTVYATVRQAADGEELIAEAAGHEVRPLQLEVTDDAHWPYIVLGSILALLGITLALIGWWRHAVVDHALHGGEEAVTPPWLVATLGAVLAAAGVIVTVMILAT